MKPDWVSCDGRGNAHTAPINSTSPSEAHATQSKISLSRRGLLIGGALAAVGWAARSQTALADLALRVKPGETPHDVLVTIFMRGGADGLNIVVPYGDDAYHKARPTIGVASPGRGSADARSRALDLDGFFGFHPALYPLMPLFKEGELGLVHACGSGDYTLSHFEAMSVMERGIGSEREGAASGWVARHLNATEKPDASPLRAVAFSSVMPASLRGATNATAVNSLNDFRLVEQHAQNETSTFPAELAELYSGGADEVSHAGRETLAVLDTLNRLDPSHYQPANGAVYPKTDLGTGLKQVAFLIKARVGMEAACLDRGGWDMHAGANLGNWMANELTDVAHCLAAFRQDMGSGIADVTLLMMTEFGRRVGENKTLGSDHGRGGVMLVLGGGVVGGKVHGHWPGLAEHQLEPPGDLRVTTDYRDVLAEVLTGRMGNSNMQAVFPGYVPGSVGVIKPQGL